MESSSEVNQSLPFLLEEDLDQLSLDRQLSETVAQFATNENLEPQEAPSRFREIIRAFWATQETEDVEDKQVFIKTTLRELMLYLILLVLLLLITLLTVNSNTFHYYVGVYELVVGCNSIETGVSFQNIHSINDIWKYLNQQILPALYWDTWYNNLDVPDNQRGFIGFDNKVLGVARLRQLRVDPSDCEVAPQMQSVVKTCFPAYSFGTQDVGEIVPQNNTELIYTKSAWTYRSAQDVGAASYSGPIGNYGGSGYVQDLSRFRNITEAMLQELFDGGWLDRKTRALLLDFTIYNANINMFVIVKLLFEMPFTGGVFPSQDFQPARLVRYSTTTDYFVLCCEIIYLLFICYYIIEEILEIKKHKLRYFVKFWNILDIVVIVISLVCTAFTIIIVVESKRILDILLENPNLYPPFDILSFWYGHYVRAVALCVFLAIFKLFKYVSFDWSLGQLTRTLSEAAYDVFAFLIMFCIVYFAFAQFGHLAFGASILGYSTFTQSCYSLFRIVVGDIDFPALQRAHYFFGPFFFIVYVFFAVFVLLNMFLAIINDAYGKVKEELAKKQRSQLKLGDMVKRSAKEMLALMRKKPKKNLVQLLRDAGLFGREVIPFEEFRKVLKKQGYSETEIASHFAEYDRDGDNCLNMKEQRKMENLLDLGIERARLDDEEDEEDEKDQNADEEDASCGAEEDGYIDLGDYEEFVERVDGLELSVVEVMSCFDQLLASLEQIELVKRSHRDRLAEMLSARTETGPEETAEE